MTLDLISVALSRSISQASWAKDNQIRGEKVAKARRYQDGDHDAQMTSEMKKALRVSGNVNDSAPFNSNQMDDVITTMTDRLTVEKIEGDNDAATTWAEQVLDWNRFDGLQMDVHESAIRDGDGYVLVEYDEEEQQPYLCHELAWDGVSGMLVIHAANDKNEIAAAVKVWLETTTDYADTVRVNIYYPNRIEKFIKNPGSGSLIRFDDPDNPGVWPIPYTMNGQADGEPIGVPVVQFRNRARGKGGYGLSELENAIPLQDALNRTLHSMVMTGELSAFPIMVARGFKSPAALTPGVVVNIADGGMANDQIADLTRIPGSDLTPYIAMAEFFIGRIEAVTRTPNMNANTNLSGEAMKQSEIKLLGKVKRFQVTAGNAWEDVMALAARVQTAYGTKNAPASKHWRTKWADAEIRNDSDTVKNAMLVKDVVGQEQTVRNIAPVWHYDEKTIQKILADNKQNQADRLSALVNNYNSFNGNGANINGSPAQNTTQPNGQGQGVLNNG